MHNLRILNDYGRTQYAEWVRSAAANTKSIAPLFLLNNETSSFSVDCETPLPAFTNPSKFEFASRILPLIEEVQNSGINEDRMKNLYDTLALHYFDLICPKTTAGVWKPSSLPFYCYEPNVQRNYRHRIFGPVLLVKHGGDAVKPFMNKAPHVHGDYEENIGSRQEIAANKVLLQVLAELYTKGDQDKLLSGYTTRKKMDGFKKKMPRAGNMFRFCEVTKQLRRTYDFNGISKKAFISILPQEFTPWLKS